MILNACGYIVLRKPEFNFDNLGRGSFSTITPKIGSLVYAGIDRMSWFELDEDYYSGNLSSELRDFKKELIAKNRDSSDFQVSYDFDKARKALDHSNKDEEKNELSAIYSKKMERTKGLLECDADAHWLGVDIYCHGYGSIIREGIFEKPELFQAYLPELNENGLFESECDCVEKYLQDYLKYSKEYDLEPIDGALNYLDHISIARIHIT